ncbi:hypothetical protein CKO36_10995 [Rhabdochromatium marinum]|nr:hypothetical protein [Rhabdochromatium marinum]
MSQLDSATGGHAVSASGGGLIGGRASVQGFFGEAVGRLVPRLTEFLRLRFLALASLLVLIVGCSGQSMLAPVEFRDGFAPAPPGYYRILRGDTLMSISRRTGYSLSTLAAWNDLGPPYPINAGSLLRIVPPRARPRRNTTLAPGTFGDAVSADSGASSGPSPSSGAAPTPAPTSEPKVSPAPSQRTAAAPPPKPRPQKVSHSNGGTARVSGVTWRWPLSGAVKSNYRAGDRTHQGVRIASTPGAKVGAAAKGTVVYSGSGLKGYGNLIIVKHNEHFLSVYGFNRRLLAKQGDRVRAGQQIAESGQAPDGEHLLHFEIRRDGATVNPLAYLPKR